MTFDTKEYYLAAERFPLLGNVQSIEPYGEGHINVTVLVTTDRKRYIMQKMNTSVFPDPDRLMQNVCAVTEYLQRGGAETLTVVRTHSGEAFYKGEACYRVYDFIEGTVTFQQSPSTAVFAASAAAFGDFAYRLSGFDASVLTQTIPNFHDTPKRYQAFCQAVDADVMQRAKSCQSEIAFVRERAETYGLIVDGLQSKRIPLRVTHNDTKLNNVLMDAKTLQGRAVIDLDTVMPGSLLYDFGDSIRFGASTAAEDERDLSLVHFDRDLYNAYAESYLKAVCGGITAEEEKLLPYGAYMMTVECGMRFLTDYLSGDTYFKIKYPEHNLVRCHTQFRLADEMQKFCAQAK